MLKTSRRTTLLFHMRSACQVHDFSLWQPRQEKSQNKILLLAYLQETVTGFASDDGDSLVSDLVDGEPTQADDHAVSISSSP